jgi:hypothetical protein
MLLLHICRAWRSIAISTPGLWVDLRLDFDHLSQAFLDTGNFEEFLANCLVRAGACPLSLKVGGSLGREEEGQRLIPTTLNQLSSHILVLDLCIDINHYPDRTPDFLLLRKLKISLPFEDDDDTDLSSVPGKSIQIFSTAPQLREIYLFGNVVLSHFAIPWGNLAVFTGEQLSSRACLDVLRLAPSLVECTFHEPYLDPDTPSISHPNLKSFSQLGGDILFQFLTLPALQTLTLGVDNIDSIHPPPFISRSSRSLLKFSWETSPTVPLEWLCDMVALTELKLYSPETDYLDEFFRLLKHTSDQTFLPQLQVLELTECSPYISTNLVQALASRRTAAEDGGPRLRSFSQIWQNQADGFQVNYDGYFGDALEELAESGMKVYIGPRKTSAWLFGN